MTPNTTPVHIAVVLDRSGSMAAIADDVVGGLNAFLAEQRRVEGSARLTLAQFDGDEPFVLLLDAVPVAETVEIPRDAYQPRGLTPLYDAAAEMISRLLQRRRTLQAAGSAEEDVVVAIITDGQENASHRFGRDEVFDMIAARKAEGWTFVFMGANQDAYGAGGGLAVGAGSTSGWRADKPGTARAMDSLSRATSDYRGKPRTARRADVDEFFGGRKEAEEDEGDKPGS
jgi:Mg-chelatase subunit ChlD